MRDFLSYLFIPHIYIVAMLAIISTLRDYHPETLTYIEYLILNISAYIVLPLIINVSAHGIHITS